MKMEQDASPARPATRVTGRISAAPGLTDWVDGRLPRIALDALPNRSPRYIARAPGRFDIMGGFIDYSGGAVLFTPTATRAIVALQPRDDDKLLVLQPDHSTNSHKEPTVVSLAQLVDGNGTPGDVSSPREFIGEAESGVARAVIGTLTEAIHAGLIERPLRGFTFAVVLGDPHLADCAESDSNGTSNMLDEHRTAITAATLSALATALEQQLEAKQAAGVCQTVENKWFDVPLGPADADCAWWGEPESWIEIQYAPFLRGKSLLPPDSIGLVGLHCGSRHPASAAKFTEARVAAFMGRTLIDKIMAAEGPGDISWDGYLSRVNIEQYVNRLRDRIPTKLKGRDFLDRFGDISDPLARVNPETIYKVRSRTEHHIYEHARSKDFMALLESNCAQQRHHGNGAGPPLKSHELTGLGEIMYASHWSYGQRCGLGSIEADRLVTLIRQRGTRDGLFGARITGRGCGGCVAVLMDNSDQANAALASVIDEYQTIMGKSITVQRGSIPGAWPGGVRRV
jgi:galactokinase